MAPRQDQQIEIVARIYQIDIRTIHCTTRTSSGQLVVKYKDGSCEHLSNTVAIALNPHISPQKVLQMLA
jgi:hypothetical protein